MRRRALEDAGGWDHRFVGGGDDIDFSWRVVLAGYRIAFADDAEIAYRHRSGDRALMRQHYRYGRAEPLLFALYRDRGLDRVPTRTVVTAWVWIIARAPRGLRAGVDRSIWLRTLARRWGRLVGSVRFRTSYL